MNAFDIQSNKETIKIFNKNITKRRRVAPDRCERYHGRKESNYRHS